jgi:hypothetical protein
MDVATLVSNQDEQEQEHKTRPKQVRQGAFVQRAALRGSEAMALRLKGLTWREIGRTMGVDYKTAMRAGNRALALRITTLNSQAMSQLTSIRAQLHDVCTLTHKAILSHHDRPDYIALYLKASTQLGMWYGLTTPGTRPNLIDIETLKQELIECDSRGPIGAEAEEQIRLLESQRAEVVSHAKRKHVSRENAMPRKKKSLSVTKEVDELLMAECEQMLRVEPDAPEPVGDPPLDDSPDPCHPE